MLVTLLQALNIPLQWPTGKLFNDVSRRTPYASAIETAARQGLVSGITGPDGVLTGGFGPDRPVNRAELAKIVSQAVTKFRLAIGQQSSSSSR